MKKLSMNLATAINRRMIEDYSPGEMAGVKEQGLLNSAIERPFQTMFGDELYPDIFTKATALFESIAKNHVFFNGNKRTALGCVMYFLYINDQKCVLPTDVAADLVVDFVTKKKSFADVVELLEKNSVYAGK
ncbi:MULTISPECIES: type II toxin-antitoxin system death-on-curing family toxin [unclassified Exiguobacterium]|uniref:type II toxin-antitoxin system death-on-curing family toxin n=1 Tax=unclassified Exiguobacterium TaxID=2644629 RepID=UPI001BE7582D|nr:MULTISPECIES: type II toxin-antitoxin system death-on-curing family toxin [unclassified Exiguobacterium]